MSKTRYHKLEGFKHVYLEDSYVMDIEEAPGRLRMIIDTVLVPGHPDYQPPRSGEWACFKLTELDFTGVTEINWLRRHAEPIVGPEGEQDFGNIESFTLEDSYYELEGEWGHVKLKASKVENSVLPVQYEMGEVNFSTMSTTETKPKRIYIPMPRRYR